MMLKKHRIELERTCLKLEELKEWIQNDRTQVCRKFCGEFAPIEKRAGSPLQFLETALDSLWKIHSAQFRK